MAFVDRINIRIFKWDAEVFMENPDIVEGCNQAAGVVLIRATIIGATTTEVVAVPYSKLDMPFLGFLHEIMRHLSVLGSFENLPWITFDLLAREMILKFGPSSKWLGEYPNHALVIFSDLNINQATRNSSCSYKPMEDNIKEICSRRISLEHVSTIKLGNAAELNLDEVDKIEDCLKVCPGMVVVGARGMKEAKASFMDTGVVIGSEEEEDDCPICFETITVGCRCATSCCCSRKFHRKCITKWLKEEKSTCPMCRAAYHLSF